MIPPIEVFMFMLKFKKGYIEYDDRGVTYYAVGRPIMYGPYSQRLYGFLKIPGFDHMEHIDTLINTGMSTIYYDNFKLAISL